MVQNGGEELLGQHGFSMPSIATKEPPAGPLLLSVTSPYRRLHIPQLEHKIMHGPLGFRAFCFPLYRTPHGGCANELTKRYINHLDKGGGYIVLSLERQIYRKPIRSRIEAPQ